MQGWFFAGMAVGLALAAAGAWYIERRHVRQVREAERRARAAERMAEIGAMTGGLAHEIKNPLSTIGLNAQLLQEGIEELSIDADDRSRLLTRTRALRRETERLGGILSDFLEYAGQVHLDLKPADLNAVVRELADFFLPEAERHGVRMNLVTHDQPLMADVDVKKVKQALLNLMLNATQAMSRDDRVAGERPVPMLLIQTSPGREADGRRSVRTEVVDTGPGIPGETLGKIFEPYFTTRPGGSGLGLPTSRRLIEEHGGRIDVESEVGRGTRFVVVLPVEAQRRSPSLG